MRLLRVLLLPVAFVFGSRSAIAQWIPLPGPLRGEVENFVTDDDTVYAITYPGRIFKSIDEGKSWSALAGPTVSAVAVSHGVIWAGTDSSGVYTSADAGATWQDVTRGLPRTKSVWMVKPIAGNIFVQFHTNYTADNYGFFRSSDNGANWTACSGLRGCFVSDLIQTPSGLLAATDTGIFRSTDGGLTWDTSGTQSPSKSFDQFAQCGNSIIAKSVDSLYFADSTGKNWMRMTHLSGGVSSMAASGDTLFIANGTLHRSTTKGYSWNTMNCPGYVTEVGRAGSTVMAGAEDTIYRSTNVGREWNLAINGLTASASNIVRAYDDFLVVGVHGKWPVTSFDDAVTWEGGYELRWGLLAAAKQGDTVLALLDVGDIDYFPIYQSTDGGHSFWDTQHWFRRPNHFTTANDNFFEAGFDGISRSPDGGGSWIDIGQGLPAPVRATAIGSNGSTVFVALSDGVYRTMDNGSTWSSVYAYTNFDASAIGANATNVYIGTNRGMMLRSNDLGNTWSNTNSGLPVGAILSIAIIHDTVFCAVRDSGVFESMDRGSSWHSANAGLVNLDVRDLSANSSGIFAATYGNGLWKLPMASSSVSEPEITEGRDEDIQAYPNPTSASITISVAPCASAMLSIYNDLGIEVERLHSGPISSGRSFAWDASNVSDGTYFCVLREGEHTSCKAVQVQH